MSVLAAILPNFGQIFYIAFQFVANGGWIIFMLGLVYVLWRLYRTDIIVQYLRQQKWVFLQIKVPKENRSSLVGVDNIFSQLHSLYVGPTFFEKYVEGHFLQLWYSLEIVSFGGKVTFIIRAPLKMRNNLEAAIYAQYPTAEITEVEDYMANINFNPNQPSDIDIFGTEWKVDQNHVVPIKTYKEFEHPSAEEKIIDPLNQVFESLAKIEPHEFFGIQINIMPIADETWKPASERKIKELTGEELPHEPSFSDFFAKPVEWFSHFSYKQTLLGGGHGHDHGADENKPRNNWLSMTESEKRRVTMIEEKANKPGYWTKIRFLYIAPKGRFDRTKASMFTGAYRPFSAPMFNKLKPDIHTTWTNAHPRFSPLFEKPYLDWLLKHKKRMIFKGYKTRDVDIGSPMFILNSEELATLYHFPMTTETTTVSASIDQTETKKSQPPADLPVAEL